ncbi:MAG: MFS transporter [Alphaproteobacteria bacterium]|nr:MFS transporter [Alphaproteobacteria bacterium]
MTFDPQSDDGAARGVYSGWWVAAGGFVMAFYAWGVGFYGHGLYMVVLGRSTGWPVSMLSSVVAGFWLANVAASLVLGRIADRFGARPAVVYGALAMAAGCFALAAFEAGFFRARWQLFAIFALMGSAYPGLAAMAVSAALVPWFKRRLGLALGIALTGASAGGAVMPPLMEWLSARYGFGPAMTGIGATLVLCVLPVALFLVRPPVAREAARELGPAAAPAARDKRSPARILGDFRFWLILSACSLSLGAQVGFLMHQIPLLQGPLGLSGATFAVSIAALSAAAGRFVLGALSGRFSLPVLAAGCYLVQALGLLLLLAGGPPALLFIASGIAGFVIGCIVMLPPLLLVDSFGQDGYGTAYGVTAASMFSMAGLATAAGGWLFDATGAYVWPLLGLTGLHLLAGLLVLWHGRRQRSREARL